MKILQSLLVFVAIGIQFPAVQAADETTEAVVNAELA